LGKTWSTTSGPSAHIGNQICADKSPSETCKGGYHRVVGYALDCKKSSGDRHAQWFCNYDPSDKARDDRAAAAAVTAFKNTIPENRYFNLEDRTNAMTYKWVKERDRHSEGTRLKLVEQSTNNTPYYEVERAGNKFNLINPTNKDGTPYVHSPLTWYGIEPIEMRAIDGFKLEVPEGVEFNIKDSSTGTTGTYKWITNHKDTIRLSTVRVDGAAGQFYSVEYNDRNDGTYDLIRPTMAGGTPYTSDQRPSWYGVRPESLLALVGAAPPATAAEAERAAATAAVTTFKREAGTGQYNLLDWDGASYITKKFFGSDMVFETKTHTNRHEIKIYNSVTLTVVYKVIHNGMINGKHNFNLIKKDSTSPGTNYLNIAVQPDYSEQRMNAMNEDECNEARGSWDDGTEECL